MTAAIPGHVASDIIDAVEGCYCDDCLRKATALIARALQAERERCAKIAASVNTMDWKGGDDWAAGFVDGQNAAAAAIRQPTGE